MQGTSNHATYAPLSHEQTISVCRHLQDQIDAFVTRLQKIEEHGGNLNHEIDDVRDTIAGLNVEQNFKDMRSKFSNDAESNRKELGRTSAAVQRTQQVLDQAGENLLVLREAQKVTNVNVQNVAQDVAHNQESTASVREVIEKKMIFDVEKLRDELSKTNLHVRNLECESEAQKVILQVHREEQRKCQVELQGLRVDLGQTDVRAQLCDQRVAELCRGVRETRQSLEETQKQEVQHWEAQERLAVNVAELNAGLKKAAAQAKMGQDIAERTLQDIQVVSTTVGNITSSGETTRQGLEHAQLAIRCLREGQDRNMVQQNAMITQLDNLRAALLETKRSLSQTNSMVLPNLNHDGFRPVSPAGWITPAGSVPGSPGFRERESGLFSPSSTAGSNVSPSSARTAKGSKKAWSLGGSLGNRTDEMERRRFPGDPNTPEELLVLDRLASRTGTRGPVDRWT